MPVISVLSARPVAQGEQAESACFHDLNLDQVCARLVAGREWYNLLPFLRTPLRDVAEVDYRGTVKDYHGELRRWPEMNHVEEQIADRVVRLFPAEFAALDGFCGRHAGFQDENVAAFDRSRG